MLYVLKSQECLARSRKGLINILFVVFLELGDHVCPNSRAQDTKLKKEENLDLLKKLASAKVDTSLLRSSKNLGKRKDSRRATLARALRNQKAGLVGENDHEILYDMRREVDPSSESGDTSSDSDKPMDGHDRVTLASLPAIEVGKGLKRPLETGADGNPVVKRRQRTKNRIEHQPMVDESSWDGFHGSSEEESASNSETGSQSDSNTESDANSNSESSDSLDGTVNRFPFANKPMTIVPSRPVPRVNSNFKAWAKDQINEAQDFKPTRLISDMDASSTESPLRLESLRPPETDPLPPELTVPFDAPPRKASSVLVDRPAEVQEGRLKLPIVAEEQKIMEAIHNNPIVIVCGATGSGKTTQIPQFLYEAGYGSIDGPTPGLIGVTQPRRVAAVTMAKRVGEELCSTTASSYQIRFDSTVGKQTAIKFMTDGILIREISQDFALMKYSVIVIDEAHERSVNTDILIGMVSRIVSLRTEMNTADPVVKPLKLVVMSATLMVDAFTKNPNLFRSGPPPLVESEGRQYPVTIHFARRTQRDYVEEAYRKVVRGHRKLPPGGMLVFLTGQNEIIALAKRLKQTLSNDRPLDCGPRVRIAAKDAPLENEDLEIGNEELSHYASASGDDSGTDDEDDELDIGESEESVSNVLILPLYSQLPTKQQLQVFEPAPEHTRLIILATNVAETSITIPGIRFVFDCGRSKEKKYDKSTGVQSFEIGWISKASATQRAGRAGRTGPGHCYRLYSSAVFERDFSEHTEPEILRMPAEGIVLQLKSMDLQHVVNFPFPTPPDRDRIYKAETFLSGLGALDRDGRITPLGRDLSVYPLSPRFARMLAIGHQFGCIYLTTAMVASLAIPELFIPENLLDLGLRAGEDKLYSNAAMLEDIDREKRRNDYSKTHNLFSGLDKHSDALKLLSAFCDCAWAINSGESVDSFSDRKFLRTKALKESLQLYQQLLHLVSLDRPGSVDPTVSAISPPSKTQITALKQIVAAGFLDQVAIRADLSPSPPDLPRTPKRVIDVPYFTLFPSHEGRAETLEESAVFIHPSSILTYASPKDLPQFLIYSRLQRTSPSTIANTKAPKTRMYPLVSITSIQLSALARNTPLLEYGKPVGKIEMMEGRRDERIAWVVPSLVGEKGGKAWPLPAVKVLQKRDNKGEWLVDKIGR